MVRNKCFLLDTQIFIWWMMRENRLKKEVETILKDPQSCIFLSIASVWEIIIKKKIGKLRVPHNWKETLRDSQFEILSINLDHIFKLETLPLYHHDPFDRVLIAQAQVEEATIITADEKIGKYKVDLVKT